MKPQGMTFFKSVLSTVLGLFIFSIVSLLLVFIIIVGIVAASSEEAQEVTTESVLHIRLNGQILERVPEDPLQEFFGDEDSQGIALLSTLEAIKKAKTDENIKGIYLSHGDLSGGYASVHEIRSVIEDFKTSGKFVYSYAEYMTEKNYYVASVADEIMLHPIGNVEFNGFNANVSFFKGLLDKLEIEVQIFRVGDYKSAVEPFMRKDMSESNKEQMTSLNNDLYNSYLENVSVARGIDEVKLNEISSEMLVRNAKDALDYKLITKIGYQNEAMDVLKEAMGLTSTDDINYVPLSDYIRTMEEGYSSDRVAVIVAEGEIISGNGENGTIGSSKFMQAIRDARDSKRVKAVVIRINSPGGSVMASDVLWNEIMLLKAEKPVIASMSAVAASGGYYMAMPCDTIVAQPMTITGSIGIFGMLPNMQGFLENKLGITNDGVNTGKYSDIFRVSHGLNDFEKAVIQKSVEDGYETFTSKAAAGRKMSIEDLKKVASGRVWTGAQAKEIGLVDVLGSYDDAVRIAATAAGIENDYQVTFYPTLKSKWEEMFGGLSSEAKVRWMNYQYGDMADYVNKIKELKKYEGIQARMPFDLEIQ